MTRPESGLRKGLFLIAVLLIGFGAYHFWTTRLGGYIPLPWVDRPIFAAVKSCDADRVRRILARDRRSVWRRIKKSRAMPLHWAARKCGPQVVRLLLDRGAPLTSRTRTGAMPLHWAAAHGRIDTIKFLLDRGAWLEAKTFRGATPMHWAARRGDPGVVKFLLSRGANSFAFDRRGKTPATWARRAGKTAIVRLLVPSSVFRKPGQPAKGPSSVKPTPPAKPKPVVKPKPPVKPKPVAKPAPPAKPKPVAKPTPPAKPKPVAKPTPPVKPKPIQVKPALGQKLIAAVKAGDQKLVERLVKADPRAVKAVDPQEGGTALHWAARLGRTEIVVYLIGQQADRRVKDKKGLTPSDWANQAKHPDIAALLSPGK
jgi:ankyrin repeat protein